MGIWSSIKNAAKWVWRKVKGAGRIFFRLVLTLVGLALWWLDIFLGFITKKLTLHIVILSDVQGPVINPADPALTDSIEYTRRVLKDRFNVTLRFYSRNIAQVITDPAPAYALNVCCCFCAIKEEFDKAGEFFAKHLAGWNSIPISIKFPITVFIVNDIHEKIGCSLGPLTDYVTLDIDGVKSITTMMHEIGHACHLVHWLSKPSELMWPDIPRGDEVKWIQKRFLRTSRHVTFW